MSDDKNINEDNKKPIDSNIKDYKSIKLSKENNFSFKSKGSISKNKDNYCKCFNESINECNNQVDQLRREIQINYKKGANFKDKIINNFTRNCNL